jgi:NAD(P)H-hydrate epimerase
MKILTAQQMRELDRLTVERCGISYATLMETAGSRVVEAIIENYGPVADKSFAVFCGKGNNGGDGAVIARLLFLRGAQVKLFLFGKIEDTKGEARTNFDAAKLFGDPIIGFGNGKLFYEEITNEEAAEFSYTPDFFIDALLGTGLTRQADGLYAQAIRTLNSNVENFYPPAIVVAVDIPSGISSDQDSPSGVHVRADLTVSLPPRSETCFRLPVELMENSLLHLSARRIG